MNSELVQLPMVVLALDDNRVDPAFDPLAPKVGAGEKE
jgi:hypothetical protein